MRCGADTGGTFTDVVADDGRIVKVLSTPDDPSRAVAAGLADLLPGGPARAGARSGGQRRPSPEGRDEAGTAGRASSSAEAGHGHQGRSPAPTELLAHGTTVATNALLERQGASVALVTTAGFADVIEIARQDRPSLYDAMVDRPEPLVPRGLRLEVGGRLDATGEELEPLDPASVPEIPAEAEAVAVCLLHADLDARHEAAVARVLAERGIDDISCSSQVSPEFREYERTVTTVVNAYLRPRCRRYLRSLVGLAGDVLVMTSAGGLVPVEEAAEAAVALLLSGPAGGVRAGGAAAVAAGWPDAVTFDMGGTSTDACLVRDGAPEPAAGRTAAGFPIRLPALDIHTIGAGGGSIARLDAGGALVVGPASAGADPGPACYGRGGTRPTVTDADLALGRILAGQAFAGLDTLDADAARRALGDAGVAAEGVVAVVDESLQRAVRAVSVERGVDPAGLALVAFGGAGPLHGCAVAEAAGMGAVIVPPRAGVLSAVGLLCSPRQRDVVRSWPTPACHDGIDEALAALAERARRAVLEGGAEPAGGSDGRAEHRNHGTGAEGPPSEGGDGGGDGAGGERGDGDGAGEGAGAGRGRRPGGGGRSDGGVEVTTSVDCRYAGQSHELTVARVDDFEDEHRRRNGYARNGAPVEVVALRARASSAPAVTVADLGPPPVPRHPTRGPAVIAEPDCTVWVPEGWSADVAPDGSWVLTR
ncbi:MAG: hydantoinase/oxoprolinase family protein [Acidimicrobiales bacterium]